MPKQWLRDGLQIKIIYPFSLKPWHKLKLKKNKEKNKLNSLNNKKKINYSYLTAWGFQTNAPFGDVKKKNSFWKPIRKELAKKWKKQILLKFNKFYFNILFLKKK